MDCPFCAKQIPDLSTFCLSCGKPIRPEPDDKPERSTPPCRTRSGLRPFLIAGIAVVGLYLLFALVIGTRGSSRSLLHPFSNPVLLGQVTISPLHFSYWRFEVNPTMTNARLVGNFHTSGGSGNDIEAVVADWRECENWVNGHPAQVLYASGKTTNGKLDVPLHQAGSYCLAFSNTMSLLSSKTVSGDVALRYLLR